MSERLLGLSALLRRFNRATMPPLDRLRWLGIWLPVVVIGVLLGFSNFISDHFHLNSIAHLALDLIVMGLITGGAFLFSRYIFHQVRQQGEEIRRRNQELATLNAVSAAVNDSLDLNEVLTRTLDKVLEVTRAEAGEIFLLQPDTDELILAAFRGRCPEAFQQVTRFKLSEGFPGWIAETGEPIITQHLSENDPRFIRTRVVDAGFRSYAGVPLRSKGKLVGVLGIAALDSSRPSSADVDLLAAIGRQVGVAIENAALHAQLAEMTMLEERQRIARELHDGVAQELGYLYMKMGELETNPSPGGVQGELSRLKEVAGTAYEEVRQAIFDLKMIFRKGIGLVSSLADYLQKFTGQTGIVVELKVSAEKAPRLAPRVEAQLTRIIQEALANVRKHARADRAWVIFESEGGKLKVTIQDDGQGFDPARVMPLRGAGFGLQTMRERAKDVGADLSIEAAPGQGTKVIVRLPLEA